MSATRTALPQSDPGMQSKPSMPSQYRAARATTLQLAQPLSAEDQMVQSSTETSPTKWHLAHTTWFFETFLLLPCAPGYRAFDERFAYLFNSYYKQLDGHPPRTVRGAFSRPTLAEVEDYRHHVDQAMEKFLAHASPEQLELAELGVHHEQQHQELIVTDIKHAFWMNPLRPAYRERSDAVAAVAPPLRWVDFSAGDHEIGASPSGFAFDNEGPRHRVHLPAFRLASRLVTNAEYLEFITDGGYSRPELWLSDGWDHIRAAGWRAPLYWEKPYGEARAEDGRKLMEAWQVFTSAGMSALDPSEPVCHVSYYEADAYARWASARLPREEEWEIAAASRQAVEGNFLESGRLHVAAAKGGGGLLQMFGDAWEWTASPYVAYPGYRPPTGVLGEYNGKFMCNQLVLRGGSCATPQSHIRASYRNFFPPQARWQFMGIRVADDRD
ncbi:MAG: ergothioneine biosynthesis protein EgtB [Acidobacteriota bacterium]|nr:ergothioneine biosynthesis protein EgtB [Acidobacteriota bacterium]